MRSRRPRSAWTAALVLLASWVSAPAAAQSADELLDLGDARVRAGDPIGGQELYQKAYDLDPTPRALGSLGLVEQTLRRWIAAEKHLVASLREPRGPWVKHNEATLLASLTEVRRHLASIQIEGGLPGAVVKVNGETVGRLPLRRAIRAPVGEAIVEVSHPGYRTSRTALALAGQAKVTHTVELEEMSVQEMERASRREDVRRADHAFGAPKKEKETTIHDWMPWVLVGVGGTAIVVSLFTGAAASSEADDLKSACDGRDPCPTEFREIRDDADTLALVTDILWISGAAVATGGLIWYAVASGDDEDEDVARLAPACGPTGCMLTASGRF